VCIVINKLYLMADPKQNLFDDEEDEYQPS